ncbi:sigma-54-dependent transcriptional regulator [Maledivibacter halophilus]|uniref:Stage 0 sporulation protein A homolog n=1 Tax=Maledivibacter halophilus TaxID=36842 RepID=A0A1T5IS71_9FIRM|nr:sigma-54 dependent transcriptional regulator [Maledivibacter halophilus]SKC41783.1 regulatory protein, Fis family [Maledivibacter halophilus]
MKKILIIDDEKNIATSLEFALEDNYEVFSCQDPFKGFEIIENEEIDLILLDLKIGEYDGISTLKKIKRKNKNIAVIIMTAYGSIKSSVDAMKAGAYYYVTKPIDIEELKLLISNAIDYKNLNNEVKRLNEKLNDKFGIKGIIGRSKKMREVFEFIDKVKDIDTNILITGESGTGKDLVAKAIHYQGKRRENHFEAINCAAIPSQLLESELFGYEKGAFSGAVKSKKGKFSIANNGTIFLDEIGEMDVMMQSKLLRVLQEKEITSLGSNEKQKIDIRVIAATNIDMEKAIEEGRFREDLYYRLNVITIKLPSLRERKEDIPLLVEHFIRKYNNILNKNVMGIEAKALSFLENYNYKGNVRELENIIERAIALTNSNKIICDDLPQNVLSNTNKYNNDDMLHIPIGENLKTIEKRVILKTLEKNKGNKHITSSILGITQRTLRNKLKEYNEAK